MANDEFEKTLDHLRRPNDWDVDGIVSGVFERLRESDPEAAAVIEYLRSKQCQLAAPYEVLL